MLPSFIAKTKIEAGKIIEAGNSASIDNNAEWPYRRADSRPHRQAVAMTTGKVDFQNMLQTTREEIC